MITESQWFTITALYFFSQISERFAVRAYSRVFPLQVLTQGSSLLLAPEWLSSGKVSLWTRDDTRKSWVGRFQALEWWTSFSLIFYWTKVIKWIQLEARKFSLPFSVREIIMGWSIWNIILFCIDSISKYIMQSIWRKQKEHLKHE